MLDQLIELGKKQLSSTLSEKAGLNPAQIDDSFGLAQTSMLDTFKNEATSGNIGGLLSLFNGQSAMDMSNPIVKNFAGTFTEGIISKLGIPEDTAKIISDTVVPFLIQKFGSKETGNAPDAGALMEIIGLDKDSAIDGMLKNVLGDSGGSLLKGLGGFFK